MKSIVTLALFGAELLLSVSAVAALDAGPTVVDAGNSACATTDDCSPPTPYCHPTLHQCVQCLGDLNCFGVGYVCNQEKGICASCRTSADCYGSTPYCSDALNACVTCLTDANCGVKGVKCTNGVCGACGDGVCTEDERVSFTPCADCYAGCGKSDLRSKVGASVASGTLSTTDMYTTSCGAQTGLPGATYSWTAPSEGLFTFQAGGNAYVSVIDGDCGGRTLNCSAVPAISTLTKGEKVVIILAGLSSILTDFTLSIEPGANTCSPPSCPVGVNGEPPCCLPDQSCGIDPGKGCMAVPVPVDPGNPMACVGAANLSGEQTCNEVTCGCNACPKDRYSCSTTTGCNDIVACMARTGCQSKDCYSPALCSGNIDAAGGVESPAFAFAVSTASCERGAGCGLTCPNSGVPDASAGAGGQFTGSAGGPAGSVGASGRSASGAGGNAGNREEDAGAPRRTSATTGGCGCSVPATDATSPRLLGLLAVLGLAGIRRRNKSKRRLFP